MKPFNRPLTDFEKLHWEAIKQWRNVNNLHFIKIQAKFIKKINTKN